MKLLHYLILVVLMVSCSPYGRKKLTIARSLDGTEAIKTDGLYYRTYEEEGKTYTVALFLYQNGVVYGSWKLQGTIEKSIDQIPDPKRNIVFDWGIYNVSDSQLIIQKWVSGSGGPYPTWTYKGTILNDTTISFENKHYGVMKFYPLEEKPDSTNLFIE